MGVISNITVDANNRATAVTFVGGGGAFFPNFNQANDTSVTSLSFSSNTSVDDLNISCVSFHNPVTNIVLNGGEMVITGGPNGLGGTADTIGAGVSNISNYTFVNTEAGSDSAFGTFLAGTGTIDNVRFINTNGATGWFLGFAAWLGTYSNITLEGFLDGHGTQPIFPEGFTFSGLVRDSAGLGSNALIGQGNRNRGYTARILLNAGNATQDFGTISNCVFPIGASYGVADASHVTCEANRDVDIFLINNRYEDNTGVTAGTFKVSGRGVTAPISTLTFHECYTWRPTFLDTAQNALNVRELIDDARVVGLNATTRILPNQASRAIFAPIGSVADSDRPHLTGGAPDSITYLIEVDNNITQVLDNTRTNGFEMTKGLTFPAAGVAPAVRAAQVVTVSLRSFTHLLDTPIHNVEVNIPVYSGGANGTYNFLADENIITAAADPNLNSHTDHLTLPTTITELADVYPALKGEWYDNADEGVPFGLSVSNGILNFGDKTVSISSTIDHSYSPNGNTLDVRASAIAIGSITGFQNTTGTINYRRIAIPSGFIFEAGAHNFLNTTLADVEVMTGARLGWTSGDTVSISNMTFEATTDVAKLIAFPVNSGATITLNIQPQEGTNEITPGLVTLLNSRGYNAVLIGAPRTFGIPTAVNGDFRYKVLNATGVGTRVAVTTANATPTDLIPNITDRDSNTYAIWWKRDSSNPGLTGGSNLYDYNYTTWTPSTDVSGTIADFQPDPSNVLTANANADGRFTFTSASNLTVIGSSLAVGRNVESAAGIAEFTLTDATVSYTGVESQTLAWHIANTELYMDAVVNANLDNDTRLITFGSDSTVVYALDPNRRIRLRSTAIQKSIGAASNILATDISAGVASVLSTTLLVVQADLSQVAQSVGGVIDNSDVANGVGYLVGNRLGNKGTAPFSASAGYRTILKS